MHPEAGSELIERARHDRRAFGEIYDLYARRVYAFCISQSQDHHVAEDLTSQTFERALAAFHRYHDQGAPLSSWLMKIAANLLVDRGRQCGRVMNLGDDPLPEQHIAGSGEPDPAEMVEQWERAGWLKGLVSTLSEDQQQVVHLRFWHGYAVREVADRMGRNENATRQLLFRAMTNLREQMADKALSDV